MPRGSGKLRRSLFLLAVGFSALLAGFLASLYASYYVSPRERIELRLELPRNSFVEATLGAGVAERIYYVASIEGDRNVELVATFYDVNNESIGGFTLKDARYNSSGWVVLQGQPYRVTLESTCSLCRSNVTLILLYSRFSRTEVDILSTLGALLSITGMASLSAGLYQYLFAKYLSRTEQSAEQV
ncbi:hypothetical protein [Thermofilum pendens]|uniref:Uncharacterized protein n=1 Tax=Thermofilum pendens (strain DSM 2475 / Hrk 5) TaxID=368408 RepID=A1RWH4_THEPD|nr:hypothetical protein [Thermofilum pendens]ABL77554.1 hypothetical protein Tpen_0144 [Thermofilum pendens Hrk 5]